MIEEKDRYRCPAARRPVRPTLIPAENAGQEAHSADKLTESLHTAAGMSPLKMPVQPPTCRSGCQSCGCFVTEHASWPLGRAFGQDALSASCDGFPVRQVAGPSSILTARVSPKAPCHYRHYREVPPLGAWPAACQRAVASWRAARAAEAARSMATSGGAGPRPISKCGCAAEGPPRSIR